MIIKTNKDPIYREQIEDVKGNIGYQVIILKLVHRISQFIFPLACLSSVICFVDNGIYIFMSISIILTISIRLIRHSSKKRTRRILNSLEYLEEKKQIGVEDVLNARNIINWVNKDNFN